MAGPCFRYSSGHLEFIGSKSVSDHTFRVFAPEKLAIVQWFGSVTCDDVVGWIEEVARHPGFSGDFDGIVDLRKADLTGMTLAEVRKIAQLMIEKDLTRGKWAHLAGGPMETALAMMYSRAVSEQYPMRVFSTVESAAEYLGRDPAALLRIAG
jgi:hypothetical protein